jgi:hypothetical protein
LISRDRRSEAWLPAGAPEWAGGGVVMVSSLGG